MKEKTSGPIQRFQFLFFFPFFMVMNPCKRVDPGSPPPCRLFPASGGFEHPPSGSRLIRTGRSAQSDSV